MTVTCRHPPTPLWVILVWVQLTEELVQRRTVQPVSCYSKQEKVLVSNQANSQEQFASFHNVFLKYINGFKTVSALPSEYFLDISFKNWLEQVPANSPRKNSALKVLQAGRKMQCNTDINWKDQEQYQLTVLLKQKYPLQAARTQNSIFSRH